LYANIISYYIKGDITIREKMRIVINDSTIVIPPLVYYEIKRGFNLIHAPAKEKIFKQMCENYSIGRLNRKCYDYAAKLYSDLRAFNPNDVDLLIAAFCIINNYVLVTNNDKHFNRIENLMVENWKNETGC
jgi:tRNA(fMet)-specific endonuclease VapC